jgi:hypothetical protein
MERRISMRFRFQIVAIGVIVLLFATTALAFAQTSTVPPDVPVPGEGATVITGTWDNLCAGTVVTVTDGDGNIVGTATIQADGSFTAVLSRPLIGNEVVSVTGACGPPLDIVVDGPIPIPEAGTLMLLGTGLAGMAGYAGLRWRTRK